MFFAGVQGPINSIDNPKISRVAPNDPGLDLGKLTHRVATLLGPWVISRQGETEITLPENQIAPENRPRDP